MSDKAVLLHGFTGSPASWEAAIAAAPPEVRCRAFALPGHDPSTPCAPTFGENVGLLAARIDAAGMRGCHLIGYSLGARLALGVLVEHPGLASRATLIGAHFGLTDATERERRRDRDRSWARLLREHGLATFVRRWEALPLFATQSREQREAQRSTRLSHEAAALARSLETMGLAEMPSYWERLPDINVDVELVCGAVDVRFTGLARQALSYNVRLRFRSIANVGHNVGLEAPASIW